MISVIIPNYNGLEHLKTCYRSLAEQSFGDYRVILVDNGSEDESVKYTRTVHPGFKIIEIGYNSGFARAINEGIKYSLRELNSEYVLLLNNDIELKEDFLEIINDTFSNIPEASFIATKMLDYYERSRIDDCGDFIKAGGGSPLARGHGEKDTGHYDKEEFIFGACAGAAAYKSDTFEKVGLFDEDFFAYYEDVDFSFRAQLSGFKCYYQPKAVCYHKRGGTSSVATHGFQTEMCERNLVILRFKNYPAGIYLLYQPLFLAARLRRYYSFLRVNSFSLFLKAFKGYLRGLLMLVSKFPERIKIQRSRIVSTGYIKSLFIK